MFLALVVLCGVAVGVTSTAHAAAPLLVTTDADSGPGSLRQAILDANSTAALDEIDFAIPGAGIHVITVASQLPAITAPVTIDARTQPGYAGTPLIELNGTGTQITVLIDTTAANSSVAGVSFAGYLTAVEALGATTVDDSWIGVHADGTPGPGVPGDLSNQREGVILGHGSALRRSVLGRNTWAAVETCGTNIEVVDNRIGTNPAGLVAMPNYYGVLIGQTQACTTSDIDPVVVGRPGHGNVISGNATLGVITDQPNVVVDSNLIGVGADGSTPLPNDGGVGLKPGATSAVVHGNTIRNNGHWGIYSDADDAVISDNEVSASALDGVTVGTGQHDQIRGNRIDGNGGLGIDIGRNGITPNDPTDADSGANGLQNFPTIAAITRSGSLLTISGSLSTKPGAGATVDVYQSPACDPSGYGEGALPRGSTSITVPASGVATWQLQLPVNDAAGTAWSATATTSEGTSELSACKTDTMAATPQPMLTAWQPIGGASKGAPSVAGPDIDTFDTVIRGLDNQIWYADKPAAASWSSWHSAGGLTPSSPAASVHDVVVRGNDNALWLHAIGQGNAWQPLGGLTLDSPALTRTPDGVMHLFIRGVDDALWHREKSATGQWGAWQNLGGRLSSGPAAAATPSGEIDVAVRGADGAIWLTSRPGGGDAWNSWSNLGGGLRDAPALTTFADGSLHLFVRGLDNQLWHRARNPQGSWSSYTALGGVLSTGPGVATDPDPNRSAMTIAAMGADGQLWVSRYQILAAS